jgi:hypothetical protein
MESGKVLMCDVAKKADDGEYIPLNMMGLHDKLISELGSVYTNTAARPEPPPTNNEHPAIADVVAADFVALGNLEGAAVAADIMARKAFGMAKYRTPLQPFNGRDVVNDLYQELLDATKYARVMLYENQYAAEDDSEALDLYEQLKDMTLAVNKIRGENGCNSGTGGQTGRNRAT